MADIGGAGRQPGRRPGRGRRRGRAGAAPAPGRRTSGRPRWRWWPARPGMEGAAGLCRRRAPRRPAPAWSAWPCPARPTAAAGPWPVEAVRLALPGRGLGRRGAGRARAVPGPGGRARARPGRATPRPRCAGWWPGPRSRWWSTPTRLFALGDVGHGSAVVLAGRPPGRPHPPRRRVRAVWSGRPPDPTGSPPPAAWPPRPGRWSWSRGRSPRWPRLATTATGPVGSCCAGRRHARLATAGTGDVLSGVIGAFLARGLPARQAAALGAHVHGRAAALGPAEGLVAGDLPDLVSELAVATVAVPEAAVGLAPRPAWPRLPPGLGRDRPRRRPPQRRRSCGAWPPRPRCAPWSRPTATATARCAVARAALEGGAAVAGGRPGRGGHRAARGRDRPRRSSCSPSRRPTPPRPWWRAGADPDPRTAERDRAERAGGRAAPGGRGAPAVHVKVDTGMHRVGRRSRRRRPLAAAVAARPRPGCLEGFWTHLAVADGPASRTRVHRRASWRASTARWPTWPARGSDRRSCATPPTRPGAIACPPARYDLVRCGIALYGELPRADRGRRPGRGGRRRRRCARSCRCRPGWSAVRRLDAGERPSYGRLPAAAGALGGRHRAARLRRRGAPARSSTPAARC